MPEWVQSGYSVATTTDGGDVVSELGVHLESWVADLRRLLEVVGLHGAIGIGDNSLLIGSEFEQLALLGWGKAL